MLPGNAGVISSSLSNLEQPFSCCNFFRFMSFCPKFISVHYIVCYRFKIFVYLWWSFRFLLYDFIFPMSQSSDCFMHLFLQQSLEDYIIIANGSFVISKNIALGIIEACVQWTGLWHFFVRMRRIFLTLDATDVFA